MRRSRIFQQQKLIAGRRLSLDRDSAHYLGRVLRLKPGDAVNLFNSEDGEFNAIVNSVEKNRVEVSLGSAVDNHADPRLAISLGLGLSRGERFDYAIQKATELGVATITPLVTDYCEVRLSGDRSEKKLAHWQKVAISACEQCGRNKVPVIGQPLALSDWLADHPGGLLLDASGEASLPLPDKDSELCLLIGPEGGFSTGEVALARHHHYRVCRLGPRILRTETAPVVAIGLLQYLYGDLQD